MLFSLLLLPVALPLMGLVAIAIASGRDGPIFFRQRRVGYAGRPIDILKFRTMVSLDRGAAADARSSPKPGWPT